MAKKQQAAVQKGVRFPKWMADAIDKIAEKGGHTFTDVVIDFCRQELAEMEIYMGIGRETSLTISTKEKTSKKSAKKAV